VGRRILFFGNKVERLSAYQYSLVSLIPEIMRHLEDVAGPELDSIPVRVPSNTTAVSLEGSYRSMDNLRTHQSGSHKLKLMRMGHPLRIFGKVKGFNLQGAFFQPYIPLQQINVLESPNTKVFLAGTSNAIFTHHKSCAIDVVANADTGNLEVVNPMINSLIALTSADKKFMDDIIKPIVSSWSPESVFFLN
jgi:hypothetical protein